MNVLAEMTPQSELKELALPRNCLDLGKDLPLTLSKPHKIRISKIDSVPHLTVLDGAEHIDKVVHRLASGDVRAEHLSLRHRFGLGLPNLLPAFCQEEGFESCEIIFGVPERPG